MTFTLEPLSGVFAICRLDPDVAIPDWAQGDFTSIARTRDELSVICRKEHVPDGVRCDAGWRCLRLVGQFDLSEIGVLAALTKPLAKANISVFVIGTFDTDYLMVRESSVDAAVKALEGAGHSMQSS